jgi:nucleotide-binding universal stress UspA family protein
MMQQVLERWRLHGSADPRSAPHRVLVGVDESTAGRAALCWAAGEASRRGALLTAARAIPAPEAVPAANDQLRWETGRRLRDAVCAVTGPQAAETLVLEGDPAGELVDLSEETGLLVLGKSSRARHRPVAGSITRYCLLHAHCPVVLVPEEASPGFSAPAPVGLRDRYVGSPRTPQAELVTTGVVTTGMVTTR